MKYAIIGGNFIDSLPIPYRQEAISTPYGDIAVCRAMLDNDPAKEFIFLPRHGILAQTTDPGEVNYRGNLYALNKLGVTHIIGVASVGTCDYSYHLGTLCLLSDFIDFTKSRHSSFLPQHRISNHTGMEDIFDPALNDAIERIIAEREIPYSGRAIYACTEGPRFETAAEIRAFRSLGAQITGMTLVPEAPLARELGLAYAAIGVIANCCTGMQSYVTDEGISEIMNDNRSKVFDICFDLIRRTAE